MPQVLQTSEAQFVDRRAYSGFAEDSSSEGERRQFVDSYDGLSPEAAELARAIDGYKVRHRRRFITFEEMLSVVTSLGYHK